MQNCLFAQTLRFAQNFILGIIYMPVVKVFACLDFEQKSSFCKRLYRLRFKLTLSNVMHFRKIANVLYGIGAIDETMELEET
jgi:hypothetical protein